MSKHLPPGTAALARRFLAAAFLVAGAAALAGCQHGEAYTVAALPVDDQHEEILVDKLDGRWFQRNVYKSGSSNELDAVELVYCPVLKGQPTVCRTATVWRRGVNVMIEGDGEAR